MIHEIIGNFHIQLRLVIGRLADLKYRRHYSDTLYEWEKLKRMYESLRAHGFCIPLSSCPLPQAHYRVAPWQPLKSARDLEKDKDWEIPCAVVSNLLTHPGNVIENLITVLQERRHQESHLTRWLYVVNGAIYAIARVTLLMLAFAALRKKDKRLYKDTWAKNLPGVG
jgi:hypothetical protein